MGHLFQMLAPPLISHMTLDKLTSVYFNFLFRKMETMRHFNGLLGESNHCRYIKHLEEYLAQGKGYVSRHSS